MRERSKAGERKTWSVTGPLVGAHPLSHQSSRWKTNDSQFIWKPKLRVDHLFNCNELTIRRMQPKSVSLPLALKVWIFFSFGLNAEKLVIFSTNLVVENERLWLIGVRVCQMGVGHINAPSKPTHHFIRIPPIETPKVLTQPPNPNLGKFLFQPSQNGPWMHPIHPREGVQRLNPPTHSRKPTHPHQARLSF